jgi:hypothetical protein
MTMFEVCKLFNLLLAPGADSRNVTIEWFEWNDIVPCVQSTAVLAQPQAMSPAKPGPNRPGPARPKSWPKVAFGLACSLKSQSQAAKPWLSSDLHWRRNMASCNRFKVSNTIHPSSQNNKQAGVVDIYLTPVINTDQYMLWPGKPVVGMFHHHSHHRGSARPRY